MPVTRWPAARWPLRMRLTAWSVAVMALVLAGVGIGAVLHLRGAYDESLDAALQARLDALRRPGAVIGDSTGASDTTEQLLDLAGAPLAGSGVLGGRALLDPAEIASASRGGLVRAEHDAAPGMTGPVRVLAAPTSDAHAVAVVAGSLASRDDAVADLREELSVAFPLVLAAAAVGAYLVATAALRPVERLRAHAEQISAENTHQRLPVPPTRDELARLGHTLNAMLDRLRAALDREQRFVADASHELRTPLSLLTTEIELALHRPRESTELRAALRSALDETRRLTTLAQDLLLLARTEHSPHHAGGETGALPTRLASILAAAAEHTSPGAGEIIVDCPAELAVHADPDDLQRAVRNLLDNAARHGHAPIHLRAHHNPADGAVSIEVRDHGPGIPAAFLPHAFERFTRADAARGGSGTGLGLAITAALIHHMHGTVTAHNHPEGGATITITLPAPTDTPHTLRRG
ncbi:sensor histidine kinase [Pseudonocardia acaciae]|uniref:sensor histidine kinase n=1 Tax=Pseudonocardia acaciae TaxID=551276 RepID=UPI0007E8C838|nr:ATP-binding protein [Pseudonocardia acaciae]